MKSKIRITLQGLLILLIVWIALAGWDPETFCPLGGILAFATTLYQNTMACNMSEIAVFMALAS